MNPGRITINTSKQVQLAAKKRASERYQTVSKYVHQLVMRDLQSDPRFREMVEEPQAPYGEARGDTKKEKKP